MPGHYRCLVFGVCKVCTKFYKICVSCGRIRVPGLVWNVFNFRIFRLALKYFAVLVIEGLRHPMWIHLKFGRNIKYMARLLFFFFLLQRGEHTTEPSYVAQFRFVHELVEPVLDCFRNILRNGNFNILCCSGFLLSLKLNLISIKQLLFISTH